MAMYSNRVEVSKGGPQGAQGPTGATGPSGGPVGPTGPQGSSGAFATVFPSDPYAGQVWADLETGKMYVYIQDVDSSQWVQVATAPQGPTGAAGSATTYTPATSSNWDAVEPTTIADALDQIAARLRIIEG